MKKLLLSSLLLSSLAIAEEPKHMVSINTTGLGWSGSVEKMSTEDKSKFDDLQTFINNVSFNYAYRITAQQQLGFFVQSSHSETKFDKKRAGESTSDKALTSFGIFALHNFDTQLNQAYYLGLGVSYTNVEEEVSHDFTESEGKAPHETDDVVTSYEIVAGKRFSLKKWNIENLVYSPQVDAFYRTHSKDYDDQGIANGFGMTIQPIKFDLLF